MNTKHFTPKKYEVRRSEVTTDDGRKSARLFLMHTLFVRGARQKEYIPKQLWSTTENHTEVTESCFGTGVTGRVYASTATMSKQ
jgi:hypothetical protein